MCTIKTQTDREEKESNVFKVRHTEGQRKGESKTYANKKTVSDSDKQTETY